MMLNRFYVIIFFLLNGVSQVTAENYSLNSPDGKIRVEITIDNKVGYSVFYEKQVIVQTSEISIQLEDIVLGKNPKVRKTSTRKVDELIIPAIKEKRARIRDHFRELTIDFRGKYSLIIRAYNDGVAYRWVTEMKDEIIVLDEKASFTFSEKDSLYFPEEESFLTHSERRYPYLGLSEITSDRMSCMPVLVCRPDGIRIAVTESDLLDYPGMYLTGSAHSEWMLTGKFPPYPLKEEQINDRTVKVVEAAKYIARTDGARSFPWRVMIISDNDAGLIESDMVYRLTSTNRLAEFFWIQPGKVAWDWWNALNLYGVDFESGVNTETYKYFIDFAAGYDIPYIILDEGWSNTEDLFDVNPDIDLQELLRYAESRDVGIILWVVWLTLDRQLEVALDQFEDWGVKGIKVDFMQRDDQKMVNYYEKIAREAASRKLVVDFHGAYKPTGLRRTYPNVLTREGVLGLEHNKWSDNVTPEHNLILPFTRMLAGPMDYTPGSVINCTPEQFKPVFDRPMSQGTRCHQLAQYVVYESPLQMLADSPSNFYREPETMSFLGQVPVTWDETLVPEAKISDYIVVARKKGDKWYVGAMTDRTPRTLEIKLDFLDPGQKKITIWQDGVNAHSNPIDFQVIEKSVQAGQVVEIEMAQGGGWVAVIE